jgi:hypothetical protein
MYDVYWQNAPVRVHWLGWETTTAALARAGWRLAVQHDPYAQRAALYLEHPQMSLKGVSDLTDYDLAHFRHDQRWMIQDGHFSFHINHISRSIEVTRMHTTVCPSEFQEVDAEHPRMVSEQEILRFGLFAPRDEEIDVIVNAADMSIVEHLEAIKAKQAPVQAELRAKGRGRTALEEQEQELPREVARILHFPERQAASRR